MFFTPDHLNALGDRLCLLTAGGRTMSYAELAQAARAVARRLPPARCLVAVEMSATPRAIAAYLGALAAGHAVLPLPEGNAELARHLESRFRPAASYRTAGGRFRLLRHGHDPIPLHPDLALLLQTSGSTGRGQGVRLSHRAIAANAASIADYLGIASRDRAALVLPLHYSYGLSVLHSHLARGASLWLAAGSVLDPGFAADLAASGATSLAGVPHHFQLLESSGLGRALPDSIQLLTVAGGAMAPGKVRDWHARMSRRAGRFIVMYGQTEATARIAWLPHDLAATRPDAVGVAIPGGRLSLRDDSGAEIAAPETEGELVYSGPNVMMGYAEGPADLARGHDLAELGTGDLARRGDDGLFRITGRLSRMSKIAGIRIGHDALERALAEKGHEVAVWGDDREITVAARDGGADIAAAAAGIAGIGRQHVRLVRCRTLPRHPNGKLDYPALKRLSAAPPAGDLGVLEAFRAAFAPQPVGRHDSFATLSGDSLRHVELSLALDRCLGHLPQDWESRTVAELERTRPGGRATLPTAVVARVLAILAVVTAHQTNWPVHGGAAAMMMLMGLAVAAFRWEALAAGDMRRFLAPLGAVLGPYCLVLAGYALAWDRVPWVSVLFAGNFAVTTPESHLMLPYLYWFIEVYVQITLLLAAVFLVPALRRWLVAQGRFAVGLWLLALAVALRVTLPELVPMGGRAQFTVPWVLHLFALGWCIAAAGNRRQRLIVLALACVVMPGAAWLGGNWHGAWIKYASLLALAAALLFAPRLAVPRRLRQPVLRLAQAAFPIYLLHRLVPEVLLPLAGMTQQGALLDAAAIGGGVALGLVAAVLQREVWRIVRHERPHGRRAEA